MFVLMFAAIGGGLATASVFAPLGAIPAVLSAPLGGSLCALLAAIHVSRHRNADWIAQADLDAQTDHMVATLRGLAAQGKDVGAQTESDAAKTKAA